MSEQEEEHTGAPARQEAPEAQRSFNTFAPGEEHVMTRNESDIVRLYSRGGTVDENWLIATADVQRIRALGDGGSGSVWYGRWSGSDVAIKQLKKHEWEDGQGRHCVLGALETEAKLLAKLRHPNLIDFFGVMISNDDEPPAVVTEYCALGTLNSYLDRVRGEHYMVPRAVRVRLLLHAARGMRFLHSKRCIHFDLKSHNLLLTGTLEEPVCKVGDLGLSKQRRFTQSWSTTLLASSQEEHRHFRGTPSWMAPELVGNDSSVQVDERVDVFSFGIVMWEALTGEVPFQEMNPFAVMFQMKENCLRPPIPEFCEDDYRQLMAACWAAEPSDRPSFCKIVELLQEMN